jgi:hypothetical protein
LRGFDGFYDFPDPMITLLQTIKISLTAFRSFAYSSRRLSPLLLCGVPDHATELGDLARTVDTAETTNQQSGSCGVKIKPLGDCMGPDPNTR